MGWHALRTRAPCAARDNAQDHDGRPICSVVPQSNAWWTISRPSRSSMLGPAQPHSAVQAPGIPQPAAFSQQSGSGPGHQPASRQQREDGKPLSLAQAQQAPLRAPHIHLQSWCSLLPPDVGLDSLQLPPLREAAAPLPAPSRTMASPAPDVPSDVMLSQDPILTSDIMASVTPPLSPDVMLSEEPSLASFPMPAATPFAPSDPRASATPPLPSETLLSEAPSLPLGVKIAAGALRPQPPSAGPGDPKRDSSGDSLESSPWLRHSLRQPAINRQGPSTCSYNFNPGHWQSQVGFLSQMQPLGACT